MSRRMSYVQTLKIVKKKIYLKAFNSSYLVLKSGNVLTFSNLDMDFFCKMVANVTCLCTSHIQTTQDIFDNFEGLGPSYPWVKFGDN